jgi:hypothetical protein
MKIESEMRKIVQVVVIIGGMHAAGMREKWAFVRHIWPRANAGTERLYTRIHISRHATYANELGFSLTWSWTFA